MPTYNSVAEAEKAFLHKQTFDEAGNTIEHCQDCDAVCPPHEYGGAGYVAADSGEVPVQTATGTMTVAQQRTVCKDCYDKSLAKVQGGNAKPSSTPQE